MEICCMLKLDEVTVTEYRVTLGTPIGMYLITFW